MITEKEWNQAFEHIVPTVSLGVATLSVILGIMALRRASPLGQRAYHLDGQYLVSVRYPGQWHDLREFVQPDNPDVVAVYSQYGPDPWSLYDFVCRNIDYRLDIGEFWAFPSEVLAKGTADCEDTSNLLTSLLCCGGINAYTAIGDYQGYGHAWVNRGGQILETTFTSARVVPNPAQYCPYIYFNDTQVIELWPGALGEVFELQRNEESKLEIMAEAINANGK